MGEDVGSFLTRRQPAVRIFLRQPFEVLSDLVGQGGTRGGGRYAHHAIGRGGQARAYHVEQDFAPLPYFEAVFVFIPADFAFFPFFLQPVQAAFDFGIEALQCPAELLRYFPLQVDFFGHRVFVEAVFQTARVLICSFGVDAGVDTRFGFFRSPACSGKLSRFVGDVYVAGVDAAAGGAVFAVSVAAVAGCRADPVGRPALFVGNRAVPAAVQIQTAADAEAFAFVAAVVLNVAGSKGGRLKKGFSFVFGTLAGGDDAALEVCVISDFDLIAVFSGINTALLGYRGMVCFDFALAVTAACTESVTDGNLDIAVLLFALIGFAILYALNT